MSDERPESDELHPADLVREPDAAGRLRVSPERLLQVTQFVAILAAGVWAVGEYFTFRRENADLELQRQRFEVSQQGFVERQQALALEMAQATLALRQSESALAAIDLEKRQDSRIVWDHSLHVRPLTAPQNAGHYWVEARMSWTNVSDEPVPLSFTLLEFFLVDPAGLLTAEQPFVSLGFPQSDPIQSSGATLGLRWRKLWGQPYRHGFDSMPPFLVNLGYDDADLLSGLESGTLPAGGATDVVGNFLLQANPDSWVGMVVHVGYADGTREWWRRVSPIAAEEAR